MCGIAGWIDWKTETRQPELLTAMTDALRHRGPDGDGYYENGPVHLGHRRLSIIDLDAGGQPMCNEDGSIWIVFNGEIYNFLELRADLEKRGHRFKTRCDTESIIHLYEEEGVDCVHHLRGQFAFAIWDAQRRELLLARDRLGQKPLYYCDQGDRFVFASELKSLLCDPTVSREIDLAALDAYMAYDYVPDPLCILKSVRKLRPGHTMVVSQDRCTQQRYWKPDFTSSVDISEHDALEQLDNLLEESTRLRMIADVPVGAFLSGGIDSSLVVAYMRRVSSSTISTFSIGFEEDRSDRRAYQRKYDERVYARRVADYFETDHYEHVVRPKSFDVLSEITDFFDEPFADSSAPCVYHLSKLARDHVKVALNGDGGDESFVGYDRYKGMAQFDCYRTLPKWMRRAAVASSVVLSYTPLGGIRPVRRIRDWDSFTDLTGGEVYDRCMSIFQTGRLGLYTDDLQEFLANQNGSTPVAAAYDDCDSAATLNRVMYSDQQAYLPGDLLVKVDRMTMACGLEGRSPFLDHKVVEFAARLPIKLKFKWWRQKYLLKKLLSRDFPASFVHRRKRGFGGPIARPLQTDMNSLLTECVDQSQLVRDGIFGDEAMRTLLRTFEGDAEHGRMLWKFLNLEIWYRNLQSIPAQQPV